MSFIKVGGNNSSSVGWLKASKTTTDSGLQQADVYNLLGITANSRSVYRGGCWLTEYTGYSLGMARSADRQDRAYVLYSQIFKVMPGDDDGSHFLANPYVGFNAWPHPGNRLNNSTVVEQDLSNATVAMAKNLTGFTLSSRDFLGSLNGSCDRTQYDRGLINYQWDYSGSPISDCGHMFYYGHDIPAGSTANFSFTSVTLGTTGTSNVTLHFKVIVPPNPENMTPEELRRYGIEKVEIRNPPKVVITSGSSGNTNASSSTLVMPEIADDPSSVQYQYETNLTFEVT